MGTGGGEGGDVVRQTVVGVVQPAVQVGHPVVGLVGQVSERKSSEVQEGVDILTSCKPHPPAYCGKPKPAWTQETYI